MRKIPWLTRKLGDKWFYVNFLSGERIESDEPVEDLPKGRGSHLHIQYSLTNACNLRCKHCYIDDYSYNPPFDVSSAIINRIFDVLDDYGVKSGSMFLTGGEPLLYPQFKEVVDLIAERFLKSPSLRSFAVKVGSNGTTLLLPDVAEKALYAKEKFAESGINYLYQVSIDGFTERVNDYIRGEGVLRKAVEGMKFLNSHRIPLTLHYVVNDFNYKEAFRMHEFSEVYGVKVEFVVVTRYIPLSQKDFLKTITPKQTYELYYYLYSHRITKTSALHRCDSLPIEFEEGSFEGNRCGIGMGLLDVEADGTVLACRRLPVPVGNILKDDFEKIWNNDFLWEVRLRDLFMEEPCKSCPFNKWGKCSGGAACLSYSFYGDVKKADPMCVKRIKK